MRRSLLDEEEEGTPIASRQREQDKGLVRGMRIVSGAESQEKAGGHGPEGARAGLLNL